LLDTWLALSLKFTDSKPSSFFRPSAIIAGLIECSSEAFLAVVAARGLRVPLSEETGYSV